jgi:hypothetical protein
MAKSSDGSKAIVAYAEDRRFRYLNQSLVLFAGTTLLWTFTTALPLPFNGAGLHPRSGHTRASRSRVRVIGSVRVRFMIIVNAVQYGLRTDYKLTSDDGAEAEGPHEYGTAT